MDNNNELKETDTKNRTCYYFDDIIKIEDFNLDNILIDEISYKIILVYNISNKTLIDAKPLHIRFDKIDGFITVYDGTRYFILFGSQNMISFTTELDVISVKTGITYIISIIMQNQSRFIRFLPPEKTYRYNTCNTY